MDLLKREIKFYESYSTLESYDTIYIGGGTPSLLSLESVEVIINLLNKTFPIISQPEITIEVNPGTIDVQKLKGYLEIGINRISIGVQSFNKEDLEFLSRIHSVDEAINAIHIARNVGFKNISIDLIFSLPTQTLESWNNNLKRAIEFNIQHISAYSLIVEKGTQLAEMVSKKSVILPANDYEALLYEQTMNYLTEHGYEQYEVSNYAKPSFQCKHNIYYWSHNNYLGFGPSAHSFWNNKRWWNFSHLQKYNQEILMGKPPIEGKEVLDRNQLLNEALMLGLRSEGIDLDSIYKIYNVDIGKDKCDLINQLLKENFVYLEKSCLHLNQKGRMVCDEIIAKFIYPA